MHSRYVRLKHTWYTILKNLINVLRFLCSQYIFFVFLRKNAHSHYAFVEMNYYLDMQQVLRNLRLRVYVVL